MKIFFILIALLFTTVSCDTLEELLGKAPSKNQCSEEPPTPQVPLPQTQHSISTFNSCQELEDHLAQIVSTYNRESQRISTYWENQQDCSPVNIQPVNAIIEDSTQQPTNTQELSVDEADIVKVSENFIFAVKTERLEVLNKKDLSLNESLSLKNISSPQLYIHNNHIAVFGHTSQATNSYSYKPYTTVKIYEISSPLILKNTFQLRGSLLSSRLKKNGLLTFISSDSLNPWSNTSSSSQTRTLIKEQLNGLNCDSVFKPIVNDNDTSLTLIQSFNLEAPEQNFSYKQSSLLGSHSQVYMGKEGLYLTKNYLNWFYWDKRVQSTPPSSYIAKFEISNDQWSLSSSGSFKGLALNQWSFKEFENHLVVATTSRPQNQWFPGISNIALPPEPTNNLYVLKPQGSKLAIKSKIENFAINESIQSVRYINSMAYVVTFRQIDPLFAIDLSNLSQPKILGELKAPGFSTYMHPIDDKTLLGFGFSGDSSGWIQGMQLSLFDIENPLNLEIIEQKKIGNDSSFSDALYDHTAFYVSSDKKTVGFPIIHPPTYQLPSQKNYEDVYAGAVLFDITDQGFQFKAEINHNDWMTEQCEVDSSNPQDYFYNYSSFDINRVFEHSSRLFSLSRFGIREHDTKNPLLILNEQSFAPHKSDCYQITYYQ